MKSRTKKIIGVLSTAVMIAGMVQTLAFADGEVDYNFNNRSDKLNAGDGGQIKCGDVTYTALPEYAEGASGKTAGDYAIGIKWADMPYTAWGMGGLEIPCYPYVLNNSGDIRTMELSFKYNEGCNYAVVQSSLATKSDGSHSQWLCTVDWVKFQNGKVYVVKKTADGGTVEYYDTGIAAEPNKWYS